MVLPVPPVHPENIEQVHVRGQVLRIILRTRLIPSPGERESPLSPGVRNKKLLPNAVLLEG